MATIYNTTARILTHHIPTVENGKVLRSTRIVFIPGTAKDISETDLSALKKSKGFKFQVTHQWLKVDEVTDSVSISDSAKELAEANGIVLDDVEPNAKGKITATEVKKHIASLGEDNNTDEDI